jgi:hypothetical protein
MHSQCVYNTEWGICKIYRQTQLYLYLVQDNQQMLKGVVSRLFYSSNYPDMFRQLTAILRGLHVPCKLLQFCLHFRWSWIMVRSVWPAAVATPSGLQSTTTWNSDKTGVAYEERVTPWGWQLTAKTCRGNLMSKINGLQHPWAFVGYLALDYKKCSVQL